MGLAGIVFGIIGVTKKQEVAVEQPVTVKVLAELHDEFASKESFDQHVKKTHSEFSAIREEHRRDRESSEKAASIRAAGIYNRIDDTRKELGDKLDDNRRELSAEINNMEARIITTLKNTGAI